MLQLVENLNYDPGKRAILWATLIWIILFKSSKHDQAL